MVDHSMSREEVVSSLRDLKAAVTALQSQGHTAADVNERMERMEGDLSSAIQSLQQLQQEDRRVPYVEGDVSRAYTMPKALRPRSAPASAFRGDVQLQGYNDTVGGSSVFVPGLLDDPSCRAAWQEDAQRLKDEWCIARHLARTEHDRSRVDDIMRHKLNRVLAGRMFTDSAGIGAEFIPELTLTSVERDARVARRVAARFRRQAVGSSSNLLPFATSSLQPYKYASIGNDENPAKYTPSSMTTAERTITPVGWAVRAQADEDAVADSLVDYAGWLRMMLVEAIVDGEEDAIINGDTGTHYHTGLAGMTFGGRWTNRGGSSDHGYSWVGLMARADDVSATVDNGSAQTAAGFATAWGKMDEEFIFGEGVFAILNTKMLLKVMQYDEVETYDGSGPANAITGGAPATLYGVPLVGSKFMSNELNASGVYDDSTKTKTAITFCDPSRFVIYERAGQRVEQDRDIERGTSVFVAKVREQFKTIDGTTAKNCSTGYNYTQA